MLWFHFLCDRNIHFLSIQDYSIGFSKIDIKNKYKSEGYISEIQIIGPELVLNNLEYNSKLNTKNWIIEEKIKIDSCLSVL